MFRTGKHGGARAALGGFVARFRPTAILHLAGLASVADSASGPGQTWRVNVNGLMNLVAAVEAAAPGRAL